MLKGSMKLKPWTKKDVILNVVTYVANAFVFVLLYFGMIYLESVDSAVNFTEYFSDAKNLVSFILLVVPICAVTAVYFLFEDRDFLKDALNSEMIFLILQLSLIICFVTGRYVSIYLRPVALAAMLALFLTNSKTAFIINIFFNVIMFIFDSFSVTFQTAYFINVVFFLITGIACGALSVLVMKNVRSRIKIIGLSFLVSLPIFMFLALPVSLLTSDNTLTSIICGFLAGPLAGVALTVLLPVFEAVFKKITGFKLAELTDHKSKLIRALISEAPGTFNHSIVVSNIAEACATAIGEDALLARTCAYYHDIGKLRRAEFFTENQLDENPHNDLMPELSANIIRSHTVDGYTLIRKNRLPQEIADVCEQHHGTMPILYFYDKAKKFTDGEVDIRQFCYAGPKPQSKIAAIIMIADSSEAATRTLKERTRERVKKVVRKIVSERMQMGQFDECEITLKELNIIINTVINSLTGIYHSRIEYPKVSLEGLDIEQDKEEGSEE